MFFIENVTTATLNSLEFTRPHMRHVCYQFDYLFPYSAHSMDLFSLLMYVCCLL